MKEPSLSRIDNYIHVSTVSSKVVLIAMAILAVGVVFWCFCGSITDKEVLQGVVFPSEGTSGVTVPNDGVVREVFAHKGDRVVKGQALALVSVNGSYSILSAPYDGVIIAYVPENQPFKAFEDVMDILSDSETGPVTTLIAYADFEASRFVKPGQQAQVTPKNETRERVGFVRGVVKSVSQYPLTKQEAILKLQNESLVNEIFSEDRSMFEIVIEMKGRKDNPQKLDWSFVLKEEVDMSVGTFCNIETITKSRSVYKYLLENVQETRNKISLWASR